MSVFRWETYHRSRNTSNTWNIAILRAALYQRCLFPLCVCCRKLWQWWVRISPYLSQRLEAWSPRSRPRRHRPDSDRHQRKALSPSGRTRQRAILWRKTNMSMALGNRTAHKIPPKHSSVVFKLCLDAWFWFYRFFNLWHKISRCFWIRMSWGWSYKQAQFMMSLNKPQSFEPIMVWYANY